MSGSGEMNVWALIQAGGPLMIPIFFCSVVAVMIFIEKMMYFNSITSDVGEFKHKVFEFIKNNKIKEAIQACESNATPVAKILKAGIVKFGSPKEEVKESMENASLYEIPKLENRLTALATIAHVTPLLGLLGTVTGMTSIFFTIQARAASMNPITPADLAGGMGQALLTTVGGLLVAIPTFVVYNYFVQRVNRFVLDMEKAAAELVNFMAQMADSQN